MAPQHNIDRAEISIVTYWRAVGVFAAVVGSRSLMMPRYLRPIQPVFLQRRLETQSRAAAKGVRGDFDRKYDCMNLTNIFFNSKQIMIEFYILRFQNTRG